jgi:hypothetical protein
VHTKKATVFAIAAMFLQLICIVFKPWILSFCIQMPNYISIETHHTLVLSKTVYSMRNFFNLALAIEHHESNPWNQLNFKKFAVGCQLLLCFDGSARRQAGLAVRLSVGKRQ